MQDYSSTCEEANRKADLLLEMMHGSGWEKGIAKVSTFTNMWRYYVFNKYIVVYCKIIDNVPKYWTLLSKEEERVGAGLMLWTSNSYYENPNDAVGAQVERAKEVLKELSQPVEYLESIVPIIKKIKFSCPCCDHRAEIDLIIDEKDEQEVQWRDGMFYNFHQCSEYECNYCGMPLELEFFIFKDAIITIRVEIYEIKKSRTFHNAVSHSDFIE